jgi:hypothetical protein
MFGAICTPLVASIAVAVASVNNTSKWTTLSLAISSGLVGCAVFYVVSLLNGKSYFEQLVRNGHWRNVGSKLGSN